MVYSVRLIATLETPKSCHPLADIEIGVGIDFDELSAMIENHYKKLRSDTLTELDATVNCTIEYLSNCFPEFTYVLVIRAA